MGNQLASFKAPDDGNMIGLGTRHIIQEQHLEMRRTVYKQLHEEQLRYLPKDQDKPRYDKDDAYIPSGNIQRGTWRYASVCHSFLPMQVVLSKGA